MENKTIFESAETFRKNVESANQWYQNLNASFLDTYTKQFGLTMDIYKKYLDTMLNLSKGNMESGTPFDLFKSNLNLFMENLSKTFTISKDILTQLSDYSQSGKNFEIWSAQGKEIFENTMKTFRNQTELIWKFNTEYFEITSKQLKGIPFDMKELTEKFNTGLKNAFTQVTQQLTTFNEKLISQNNFTQETWTKLYAEITKNFDILLTEVFAFWQNFSTDFEKNATVNAPSAISRAVEDSITQPKYNSPLKKKATESVN
ncbi:MAG: hypothetical protein A3H98_13000 [Bacteroidetes bacterium RIFCSPLOWO2_02_FULL_36_8]|nr:MAG: hypothetical protein A3H98_13000 [Bacteroidetes bacterium RIFCSPLOWO2_02_FULL_36_8]OFY69632.1 MAG: hypothetical protein A3G23_13950 [Bacteroidetes bacterium RIFCSPLOWO2_12_FULL_37_12]